LRERSTLLFNYQPKKIKADITLFKAEFLTEEYSDVTDNFNHWNGLTSGKLNVIKIEGNHSSILHAENARKIAEIQDTQMKLINHAFA